MKQNLKSIIISILSLLVVSSISMNAAEKTQKRQGFVYLDFERTVCGQNANEESIDYTKGNYKLLDNKKNLMTIMNSHIFELYGRPYKYIDYEDYDTLPSECYTGEIDSDEVNQLSESKDNSENCYGKSFYVDDVVCKKTSKTAVRMKYYSIQKSEEESKKLFINVCDEKYIKNGTIDYEGENSDAIKCFNDLSINDLNVDVYNDVFDPISYINPLEEVKYNSSLVNFIGWSLPENWGRWSVGKSSQINFNINRDLLNGVLHLQNLTTFAEQTITVSINGHQVHIFNNTLMFEFSNPTAPIGLKINFDPNILYENRVNTLMFEFSNPTAPKDVNYNNDTRLLAMSIDGYLFEHKNQRISDLTNIKNALASYYKDHKAYPTTVRLVRPISYDGLYSDWGESKTDWIKGLVPDYISKLPRDPRNHTDGSQQYLYRSDGTNYKLISHYPNDSRYLIGTEYNSLIDPRRIHSKYRYHLRSHPDEVSWAYGYWTPGARLW